MPRRRFTLATIALALTVGALTLHYVAREPSRGWKRESPLLHPLPVASVRDGGIVLEDGRMMRPAGVRRRESVPEAEYQQALQIIVAQGIEITRDLGDGHAFMMAEPRFYHGCVTCGRGWAGVYYQCPVSELLLESGFAEPDLEQPGLTPREKWRIEGSAHLAGPSSGTRRMSAASSSLRYSATEVYFSDLDGMIEAVWKTMPPIK